MLIKNVFQQVDNAIDLNLKTSFGWLSPTWIFYQRANKSDNGQKVQEEEISFHFKFCI